jgi:serine/threonine-protein kinase CHEK2
MDGPSDDGLRPAVLTCKGRNGIYVNDQRVDLDSKRILSHGDVIKLGKNKHLFKFQYTNIPQEFSSLCRDLRKKYFIGREIGSGGCGLVRLIYNLKTLERFAMKIVKKEMNPMVKNRDDVNEKIINEVNIMRSLNNIHVLGLIDSFATDSNIIIVMEYLEGRDLLHRITKHNPKRTYLNENDAKYYFLQICRGLKYLHDSKITHRDIKPDNILLVSNDTDSLVKISDFGLSKIIAEADMKTVCGTQLYVAPEILKNGNKGYSNKVDIWSLGCLLFAMLSGSVPFCGKL